MSDSDDERPLLARQQQRRAARIQSDSDDDGVQEPAIAASKPAAAAAPLPPKPASKQPVPAAALASIKPTVPPAAPVLSPATNGVGKDSDSDEDDQPLAARKAVAAAERTQPSAAPKGPARKPASASGNPLAAARKRKADSAAATNGSTPQKKRVRPSSSSDTPRGGGKDNTVKWKTLSHHGVLFPPEYEPHGIKMRYKDQEVELTPEQEEVATMYAVMLDTEYVKKPVFNANFWEGFKEVLGRGHVIKSLDGCDFTPIHQWHMQQRELKKAVSKEEKLRTKVEKEAKEGKYKFAMVDGRQEQVGNFRVEPPGLFRGRGEHPRMGRIKSRVYPRDITINIGKDEPVPEHPYPGMRWKEVRHDNTVTWLAFWKDTVNPKDFKYVWLGATSTFKADSDLAKYEKARKLKDYIGDIRAGYERDWDAREVRKKQMAVALYFLDKLALRAGHEKDDDEADTVGCCTLKVENVECLPPNHIKFDFLGKDSIRYENTVDVHPKVYKNVSQFWKVDQNGKPKKPGDQLFDTFDATDLNKELKGLMDGLSVKVFRTYNASITLDRLLFEKAEGHEALTVDAKKAEYDRANKEVAILCNHQRSIPKAHGNQMEKLQEKVKALHAEAADLEQKLQQAKKNKDDKKLQMLTNQLARKKEAIHKQELQVRSKEDLKTVALGTSKINYMDPRITVAWCMRNEVPIEKVFNKSLLGKFNWAMDVSMTFRF